mgnify:FL=1
MQEEFIFANPHCYIEEQLSNGRTLYCFREKGTNRIVIIETQNEQESKDVSGYISEAIHMRDICPAFFTPEDGDEYLELEGRVKWQDNTQLILRCDVFLKMYL